MYTKRDVMLTFAMQLENLTKRERSITPEELRAYAQRLREEAEAPDDDTLPF